MQRAATITTLEPLDADTWDTIRSASGDTAPEYDTWTGRCALAFLWHHHGLNPIRGAPVFDRYHNRGTAVEMYRRFRLAMPDTASEALLTWAEGTVP